MQLRFLQKCVAIGRFDAQPGFPPAAHDTHRNFGASRADSPQLAIEIGQAFNLGIPHVPGAGELAVFAAAIIGACLAFLWFNAPPAAVFMGDTGSLALGGALATIAVTAQHELVLVLVGGLFVVEALSVIIQVFWYKRTGKRVFRMAPIHHHFEQLGWPESTVVIRFWIVSIVLALAGLATLKLR